MPSEGEVFKIVTQELKERGCDFLIHVPGSHRNREEYQQVLKNNRIHNIPIKTKKADVIGKNNKDELIAIEIKGSTSEIGLEQALIHQSGVHRSYIAVPEERLSLFESEARNVGLGLIGVEDDKIVRWEEPSDVYNRSLLEDVRRQLTYRLENRTSMHNISSLQLSQPVNFLAPLFALQNRPREEEEIVDMISGEYNFNYPYETIRGASTLGLLEKKGDSYSLSDDGVMAMSNLNGEGVDTIDDLNELKNRTSYKHTLYVENPAVATLLRKQYKEHPEFRTLDEVIDDFETKRIPLNRLTKELCKEYPNIFLNVFCSSDKRTKARKLIEGGDPDPLHSDMDTWREVMLQNVYDNFTRQLRQIGVLDPRTDVYYGRKNDFSPKEYPWYRNPRWF
ncbi:hypothetical protein [Natrialba aegyptia]|uniref:hypothetical protein n=1 Tax=Natrialba aegyptia TaxID=129789 RepID=UPI000ACA9B5C|nr:hypothetical protein [Natrialba aegyptia]